MRPIRSLLVANRGEIAVRIFKTARQMGLRTLAVFSEADRDAMHVRCADEAYLIGPAPPRDSYLVGAKIIAAALEGGADAIHPGYGFLSENAEFAAAVAAAGLIFVGPPAEAIRAMGSKSAAKRLMQEAGVPLVPGYHGADQADEVLAKSARDIGFPVLIKASAGGGGKGMKVVANPAEFSDQLASARREAKAAFGDDTMLIERYLTRPRHIEVQVFADTHGNAVHLFERDCSVQRRHQKVIEEAPAPGLTPERREAMGAAAVAAARAVGYVGAGTVEFIAEGDDFFFMEMNTRLQVEHPVTEAITGEDLVAWQIAVARGETLPKTQAQLAIRGHAVEARLYAEDPDKDFLPQTGRLTHLRFGDGVRVDQGVESGDAVTHHYDPMIAKVIAYGPDRNSALDRLAAALRATEVVGLVTNRRLLDRILTQPAFAAGDIDTGFIERHRTALFAPTTIDPTRAFALAALAVQAREAKETWRDPADPFSPWALAGPFVPNLPARQDIILALDDDRRKIVAETRADARTLVIDGHRFAADAKLSDDGTLHARLDDTKLTARVIFTGPRVTLFYGGEDLTFIAIDPREAETDDAQAGEKLTAPMPGTVIALLVQSNDRVAKGAPLVVVEAMKMEHVIKAPHDGIVAKINVAAGEVVAEGFELIVVEAGETASPSANPVAGKPLDGDA
jgi:3-methylcrotonyl-CoA carboxylase alpha subunit